MSNVCTHKIETRAQSLFGKKEDDSLDLNKTKLTVAKTSNPDKPKDTFYSLAFDVNITGQTFIALCNTACDLSSMDNNIDLLNTLHTWELFANQPRSVDKDFPESIDSFDLDMWIFECFVDEYLRVLGNPNFVLKPILSWNRKLHTKSSSVKRDVSFVPGKAFEIKDASQRKDTLQDSGYDSLLGLVVLHYFIKDLVELPQSLDGVSSRIGPSRLPAYLVYNRKHILRSVIPNLEKIVDKKIG